MYCGQCGREIKDTAKFCPYCGSQVYVITSNNKYSAAKKNRMLLCVGLAMIIVVAVVIGIMVKAYLDGKIENRIIGSWAYAVQDYKTGEYCVKNEKNYIYTFNKDGTFRHNGVTGIYEIYEDRIYMYDSDGYSWAEMYFPDDSGLGTEMWSLENELSEYDDILLYDAGGDIDVYVKIDE